MASASPPSTPNVSCTTDDFSDALLQTECLTCKYHWMMHQSSLLHCRSRRPLSLNDVRVAETLLVDDSSDMSQSFGEDSGVFSSSPLSSSSSFSCVEGSPSLSFVFPSRPFSTSPNPHRRLQSCPENRSLVGLSPYCMEALFSEINQDIGASWRKLGRHMLKKEYLLNNIDEDFNGVSEKAYQVLLKWKEDNGASATPQALFRAILHIKCIDVAKKLIILVPSLMPLLHLLDNVITSDWTLYTSRKLNPENLEVEKELLSKDEKVLVCSSTETSGRFVLKQVEDEEKTFAVRKCIDCKALRQQHKRLRKTEEFLKDLQMKQKMIQDLLNVIKELQNHLHTQHQAISQEQVSCHNCGQYMIKQDLVLKELTLLHHELERMIQSKRRISISGIPSERIYNLATRTYTVCEEHKEMHARSRNRRSSCQHPEDQAESDENDDHIEGPLMCALNVIIGIGRRRKVTQSLKSKKPSASNKLKLSKANSNPLSSGESSLSNRHSYLLAQENPIMMPSLHVRTPGDWSGVPAFKMSSDFKMPHPNSTSATRHTYQQNRCPQLPENPASPVSDKNDHQLVSLLWLKGLEPDEMII